jgi:hypothetical protein
MEHNLGLNFNYHRGAHLCLEISTVNNFMPSRLATSADLNQTKLSDPEVWNLDDVRMTPELY